MEYLKELKVTVEIYTNKKLDKEEFIMMENESMQSFQLRIINKINESENL